MKKLFKRFEPIPGPNLTQNEHIFGWALIFTSSLLVGYLALFLPYVAKLSYTAHAADAPAWVKTGFYPQHVNSGGFNNFSNIQTWLDRKVPFFLQFGDRSSFTSFKANNGGVFSDTNLGRYKVAGQTPPFKLIYSVPLGFGPVGDPNGSLSDDLYWKAEYDKIINNTSGYRDEYVRLATMMRDKGYGDAIIRLDWEFDLGHPFKRRASADPVRWQKAYRIVHGIFRGVSPNFKFDYNYISSNSNIPLIEQAYPGTEYVDIIGLDTYDRGLASSYFCLEKKGWCDPEKAWNEVMVAQRLKPHFNFAVSKGKPISFPEWGIEAFQETNCGIEGCKNVGGDDPRFIRGMAEWMNSRPMTGAGSFAYHAYFWAQPSGEGTHKLFEGSTPATSEVPKSRDEFKKHFGGATPPQISNADLVVTNITWSPAMPVSGDNVTLSATIKNTGTTATPDGVIHGVLFKVNGAVVSWSDTNTQSLGAGASRTLTANGGKDGDAFWNSVAQGSYQVIAMVDDVNRIQESDETNNQSVAYSVNVVVPDVEAPTSANILTPTTGSTVSGTKVSFSSAPKDNIKVTKVEYYRGATLLGTGTLSIYGWVYVWDSTTVADGSYSFTAKAYDAAGNSTTSPAITLTVKNAVSVTNLLKNGNFSGGTTSWTHFTNGAGSFSILNGAGKVAVTTAGSNTGLYQTGFLLQSGAQYRLTFRAYSNNAANLDVMVRRHTSPYNYYGLIKQVDLTNAWKTYTYDFTAANFSGTTTDTRFRFTFSPYATANTTYWIDDIVLTKL